MSRLFHLFLFHWLSFHCFLWTVISKQWSDGDEEAGEQSLHLSALVINASQSQLEALLGGVRVRKGWIWGGRESLLLSRYLVWGSYVHLLVPKNPLLQLKPASVKEKKRNKKKNPISSPKKVQSPLKNKLLNSPVKAAPGASGSPQKLIEGFLKHEGPTPGKPLVSFMLLKLWP